MIPLYRHENIREFEAFLIQNQLASELELMEAAGLAAFNTLKEYWPKAKKIIVFCGKGNNGGDGYVVARLARLQNFAVQIYSLAPLTDLSPSSQQCAQLAQQAGIEIISYDHPVPLEADVIVDGLLGTGLQGPVREPYQQIIEHINAQHIPILALDIPSGVDANTGNILGAAINADVTICFIGLKQGLFTYKGLAYAGAVIDDPIGISPSAFKHLTASAKLLDWPHIKPLLPRRLRNTNKGDYGHVLVVGGDYGMGGAVRMAAEAAMRVGAGLVTVATRPEHVPVVSGSRPELMCHQVDAAADLEPLLAKATVIVVGPGMGKSPWARALLDKVLESPLPKILDADALNLISEKSICHSNWILTPHPGEASRLLGCTTQEVQADRFAAMQKLHERYGGVIVLKGSGTIIFDGHLPYICAAGNPGMASGGMGDILSGIIAGLAAQKLSLLAAAQAGVLVHALAADKAAAQEGERGLIATDLFLHLRSLVNPQ